MSEVSDVTDTLKEVQCKIVDHYAGDGLKLNSENKIQLETIEKDFEKLKVQNEFIVDGVQLITNRYKCRNDQITTIKDQTNKVQNEVEKIHNRIIKKELEDVICFKTIVDKMVGIHSHIEQFSATINGLETAVEEACENKKIMAEIMEVADYMKDQYHLQMAADRLHFAEQIGKNVSEIDQLKAYADIEAEEVDELKKRCTDRQLCIDLHRKSLTRAEKRIADMLSIIFSHTIQSENENDQLAVMPNENQKEVVSLLAKHLEEIYGIIKETKKYKDKALYDTHIEQFKDENVENVDEEKDFYVN